jgi:hypothetical protein
MTELELAAIHESAHCVAKLHFGIVIDSVRINKDGSGATERPCRSDNDYAELVCALAGPARRGRRDRQAGEVSR